MSILVVERFILDSYSSFSVPDLIFHVDTLTTRAFRGNPISVCVLEKPRERPWMREVSRELNTSETAFLLPRSPNRFDLRTMSGSMEVEMSALATLAAAHVLFTSTPVAERPLADPRRPISFFTRGGPVPASLERENNVENAEIHLNFPGFFLEELSEIPEAILQGVDPAPEFAGRRGEDYFVQVSSEEQLREIRPDFKFLREMGMGSLVVTSVANRTTSHDFVYRTFHIPAPSEDPIASYAHCLLGPFWFLRLGKTALAGFHRSPKASPALQRNPIALRLAIDGDRVKLMGHAVTIFEGELKL